MKMYCIGIDIGSTASKVCIMKNGDMVQCFVLPTGWSSVKTAQEIHHELQKKGIQIGEAKVVATGYGRVSVPYASKTVTEITCHGKGAYFLHGEDCTVIDIGGQDTKVITLKNGRVVDFTMNDKCAAGTGRFLELMANTLGLQLEELTDMAERGNNVAISSMCTVFAESEVISLIGRGTKREDIASGVIDSITGRVKSLCQKHGGGRSYFLTGGLSDNAHIVRKLSEKLGVQVESSPMGRYAGAIGAALVAAEI